jgi:hypothetical protein
MGVGEDSHPSPPTTNTMTRINAFLFLAAATTVALPLLATPAAPVAAAVLLTACPAGAIVGSRI